MRRGSYLYALECGPPGRGPDPSTAAAPWKDHFYANSQPNTSRVEEGVEFLSAAAHVQATCLRCSLAAKKIKLCAAARHKIPPACYNIHIQAYFFTLWVYYLLSQVILIRARWGAESYTVLIRWNLITLKRCWSVGLINLVDIFSWARQCEIWAWIMNL